MEGKTYLGRYRLRVDQVGIPVVIRRSAREATFEADDLKTGEPVAVQVIPAAAWCTDDQDQLEEEGKAAREINHVNIPAVRAFGFEDEQLIYVTEFFEGTSAKDWVKEKGPLPVGVVLRIAAQIVSALGAATFQGVNHPAINPANILLVPGQTAEGEWPLIKVMNFFGVAAALSASSLNRPAAIKPGDFASPEQLAGEEVDFRSQIYSLGCTLWFLLSGAAPVTGEMGSASGRLAAPLRRLLLPMLAENPEERPLDPVALQEEIQKCLAQLERRSGAAGKVGLPAALASEPAMDMTEGIGARRSIVWKPIALAAVLLALAALAAVVISDRWRPASHAIGVPVGVSEPSSAAAIVQSETESAPADGSPSSPAEATEPAVLTSTAVAGNEESDQSREVVAGNEARIPDPETIAPTPEPTSVAESSTPAPVEEATVAAEERALVSNQTAAARVDDEPAARPTANPPTAQTTASPAEIVLTKVPTDSVHETAERSAPVASASTPTPAPRRARPVVRPPNPAVNVIVPPNEPVYAAPLAPVRRDDPRRRPRAPKRDPLLDLPVLKALPPDE